jgi:hypothetical protein
VSLKKEPIAQCAAELVREAMEEIKESDSAMGYHERF